MQKQTPSSLLLVAAIAGGVGFVAFVALLLVGGFTVSPAIFLAIIAAAAAAVVLFAGFHKGPAQDHPDLRASKDGKLGDRTRKAGTAGVEPGTAGVKPGSAMDSTPNTTRAARTSATAQGAADTSTATAGATAATIDTPRGSADDASPTGPDHDDVDPSDIGGRAEMQEDRADASSGSDRPMTTEDDADESNDASGSSNRTNASGERAAEADATRSDEEHANERDSIRNEGVGKTTEADAKGSAIGVDSTEPGSSTGDAGLDGDTTEADAKPSSDGSVSDSGQKWKSSQLSGTDELSERKGEWRYDGSDTNETMASASAATAEKSDDASEQTVGEEPTRLDAPRDGGADDLKRISGVGPKMETMLNDMGFYHFDQIAGWSDAELAWVDSRLDGFKGRASRDEWVPQAKTLSAEK